MAKKTLTPEQAEIKAMKKEKKSQNWTKFWAIVLAAVLTLGVVSLGKDQAQKAIDAAKEANNNAANNDDDSSLFDDETSSNNDASNNDASTGGEQSSTGGEQSSTGGEQSSTGGEQSSTGGQQSTGMTKADVAKALNDATAKGAKASYNWTRTGKFTKDIDVGSLTSILNGIISGVVTSNDNPNDDHYTVNEVVGGFLGIKDQSATVTNGKTEDLNEKDANKYLLKAMTLTENDIQDFRVNGNTYQVQIKNTSTPDANSAWAHASNDYITFAEVNESIASAVGDQVKVQEDGSVADYKSILITAVIEDGKLTNLKYSYTFEATLKIKVGLTATGTGAAAINAEYKDFKY